MPHSVLQLNPWVELPQAPQTVPHSARRPRPEQTRGARLSPRPAPAHRPGVPQLAPAPRRPAQRRARRQRPTHKTPLHAPRRREPAAAQQPSSHRRSRRRRHLPGACPRTCSSRHHLRRHLAPALARGLERLEAAGAGDAGLLLLGLQRRSRPPPDSRLVDGPSSSRHGRRRQCRRARRHRQARALRRAGLRLLSWCPFVRAGWRGPYIRKPWIRNPGSGIQWNSNCGSALGTANALIR